jgi:parallel beta-helix repeat protein
LLKRTVSGITLTLLLIGMLTLAFNFRLLKVELGTITVPDDYPTVQEAINVAGEGDTIYMKVGTYYEHVVMNKTLSIIGENRDTTTIDGNGTGPVVHVQANNTVISNFAVQNSGDGGSGVYLDHVTNSTIRNVTATYTNAGIRLSSSPSCYIYENIVYESDHGILLFDSPFCYVCCNVIKKIYAYGIRLVGSAYSSVNNNRDAKIYLFHSPHCAVCSNIGVDIRLSSSSHCSVSGNKAHQIRLDESRNNNLTLNNCTYFCVKGDYNNYADTSNTVYGKPIYYLIDVADAIYGPETNAGIIYLLNSNDITVRNLTLTKNYCGVLLWNTTNSKIENVITSNNDNGIILECSSNNTIVGNYALNKESGISLSFSNNNTIIGNTFSSNYYGIWLGNSRNNLIIQNKVINNTRHVYSFAYVGYPPSANIWDDGYPFGGNYWSDYNDTDLFWGPYQNETGSDGIGDTLYVIDENNFDQYPLMNPWPRIHDITITSLTASEIFPRINETICIHVTAQNRGHFSETFTVAVNYTGLGEQQIESQTITLALRESATLSFTWTPPTIGTYEIEAYTSPIPGDISPEDNTKTTHIIVTIHGLGGEGFKKCFSVH